MGDSPAISNLLALPAELLQHILSLLGPIDLANAAQTCRPLAAAGYDEQLWQSLINQNISRPTQTPPPSRTYRELYGQLHLHWFLTQQAIWFADSEPSGKLLIARYNPQNGSIEAHAVVAKRTRPSVQYWEKEPRVIIHSFDPKVSLDLNQPVLKLDGRNARMDDDRSRSVSETVRVNPSKYGKEILMDTFTDAGLYSSFMLCRKLPDAAISEQARLWPVLRFPANSRTRNDTRDGFHSAGHRPTRLDEVSHDTFRLRKWVEYTGRRASPNLMSFTSPNGLTATLGPGAQYFTPTVGSVRGGGMSVRMPEDITTYATLPKSAYAPTKAKPWQGIWCGDYSGHGCEFLLVVQPDRDDEAPLPEGMNWLREWFRSGQRRDSSSSASSYASAQEDAPAQAFTPGYEEEEDEPSAPPRAEGSATFLTKDGQFPLHELNARLNADGNYDVPTGRLEAIKLTGDPHIPRGEYTFVAPDIGPRGLIRVADEEIFKGARVVRSAGHIAGRGFRADQYTPSQLIMVSHDKLAQFWEGFGHISYFQRVDLDALMKS